MRFINDINYEINEIITEENATQFWIILNEIKMWRIKQNIQFEKSKYILIYFIRIHKLSTEASIIMNDVINNLINEIKYLNIIFD